MTSTGTTEAISRFAGYLQIFDDEARTRESAGGPGQGLQGADASATHLGRHHADLHVDPLFALATQSPRIPSYEDGFGVRPGEGRGIEASVPMRPIEALLPDDPRLLPDPPLPGPGPSAPAPQVRIAYHEGGSQTYATVAQSNRIVDQDMVGFSADAVAALLAGDPSGPGLGFALPGDAAPLLEAAARIQHHVRTAAPDGLLPDVYAPDAILSHLAARRDALAEDDDAPEELGAAEEAIEPILLSGADAHQGIHVDGERGGTPDLDPAMLRLDVSLDPQTAPPWDANRALNDTSGDDDETPDGAAEETNDAPSLEVSLGGNAALNAAVVADLNEATLSLIVAGDRYSLDAIVQTNMGHDVDGGPGASEVMAKGGGRTVAENVAGFVETVGELLSPIPGLGATRMVDWTVDVFDGDFFDITHVEQTNVIGDPDAVAGTSDAETSTLAAGGNTAVNITQILTLSLQYDLIIVGGDYFDANIITQTNVLFDGDLLTSDLLAEPGGEGFVEGAAAGDGMADPANALLNDAEIDRLGNPDHAPLTPEFSALLAHIGASGGGFALTHALTAQLPNAGGDGFSVLYVTGDYVSLNAITQTNLVYDADLLLDGAGETAGNMLGNSARIVDAGAFSTAQHLGGEHYSETLLAQASLISDEGGFAVTGSDALVPELIAFLDHGTPFPEADPADLFGPAGSGGEDLMSAMLA